MGYDEVWLIGDTHLLAQSRPALDNLRELNNFNSNAPRQRLPYILEYYETIIGAYHHSWSFTTQIKGGFNFLLSTKWRLPNYIIIMFSNRQIEDTEVLRDEAHAVLKDLFTAISRAIAERKVKLPKKARRFKPPQMIIMRTLPKADRRMREQNFKLRRRSLNRVLQRLAAEFQWRSINIDAVLPSCEKHFNESGHELSEEGFRQMWLHISQTIQDLDNGPVRPLLSSPKFNHKL